MKQVAQRPRDGRITVVDAPAPSLRPGWVLVRNRFSVISAGTERSKMELGEKSLLSKARARPDLARKVVDRARAEGVRSAIGGAQERLDGLDAIGYSSAGTVIGVGRGVEGLAPRDEVACGGGGWANHADVVSVPRNLVAKLPAGVTLESAAYATVGAIALHAVRQADARVGERIGVIGLGLVGQLALRILGAAGCTPVGVDLDPEAVDLARRGGALALRRSDPGLEVAVLGPNAESLDAVLVCAATQSPDPVQLAARLARDRGRIVVVGDVTVAADRALLYDKELELRLSRSYGPGRYDRDYEEHGRDLPAEYVRWTEQRNLGAFLELVARGAVDPDELTTHHFDVEDAADAYAVLTDGGEGAERPFGILLEYPAEARSAPAPSMPARRTRLTGGPGFGVIGAGAFARSTLLPALRASNARLEAVATERGLSGADVAERFEFARAAESAEDVIGDPAVDAVVIATRHGDHAPLAAEALRAGKATFVEKPLALTEPELAEVEDALAQGTPLMVGFNRRFAPLVDRLVEELGRTGGRTLLARVNAGPLPADHWLHDPVEGGGRLLGEGCHFVDLLAHLAGSPPVSAHAVAVPHPDRPLECSDDLVATLRFGDGGVGTLLYTGAGDPRMRKERIEAFGAGLSAALDDFRRLELYRNGKRRVVKGRQDKGHGAQIARFVEVAAGTSEPPATATYLASSRATLALAESLRSGAPVDLA